MAVNPPGSAVPCVLTFEWQQAGTATAGPLQPYRKDLQAGCSLPAYPGDTTAMTKVVKTPDCVLGPYY